MGKVKHITIEEALKLAIKLEFEVIDVRSPLEYEKDHLPNAINLPVLSNEERKIIGTILSTKMTHLKQEDL